jgi:hypothetical protein
MRAIPMFVAITERLTAAVAAFVAIGALIRQIRR